MLDDVEVEGGGSSDEADTDADDSPGSLENWIAPEDSATAKTAEYIRDSSPEDGEAEVDGDYAGDDDGKEGEEDQSARDGTPKRQQPNGGTGSVTYEPPCSLVTGTIGAVVRLSKVQKGGRTPFQEKTLFVLVEIKGQRDGRFDYFEIPDSGDEEPSLIKLTNKSK